MSTNRAVKVKDFLPVLKDYTLYTTLSLMNYRKPNHTSKADLIVRRQIPFKEQTMSEGNVMFLCLLMMLPSVSMFTSGVD
jgi:hypothetical protein